MADYTYYSQCGQDRFVWQHLGESKHGRVIEVGAHDGVQFSNSKFFEDRGWHSLCLEPNPRVFQSLKGRRNPALTTSIEACATDKDVERVPFTVITGGAEMLSGMTNQYDPRHLRRIRSELQKDDTCSIVSVASTRLETVLDRLGWTEVDYLSVDTEGSELLVLQGINFDKVKFKIMTIENNYRDDRRVQGFLMSKGYTLWKHLAMDDIYVPVSSSLVTPNPSTSAFTS